jgi:2-polyprenyl-3-methyl-5-hydroxy-6-metoxy-1,4-benzoquinol methylase
VKTQLLIRSRRPDFGAGRWLGFFAVPMLRQVSEGILRRWYYRFGFGRQSGLARRWARAVAALEQKRRFGDVPRSRSSWEAEYREGAWNYLANFEEFDRYFVIAGQIALLKPGAAVLDVGCGEGLLLSWMKFNFRRYVGVDLAEAAIARSQRWQNSRCSFVQADAQAFSPAEHFDVIVFNEVLYYFDDPMETLARYDRWLAPGGLLIASLVDKSLRATGIKRRISKSYRTICALKARAHEERWSVRVFAPLPPKRLFNHLLPHG